jgi:hypothetical protein
MGARRLRWAIVGALALWAITVGVYMGLIPRRPEQVSVDTAGDLERTLDTPVQSDRDSQAADAEGSSVGRGERTERHPNAGEREPVPWQRPLPSSELKVAPDKRETTDDLRNAYLSPQRQTTTMRIGEFTIEIEAGKKYKVIYPPYGGTLNPRPRTPAEQRRIEELSKQFLTAFTFVERRRIAEAARAINAETSLPKHYEEIVRWIPLGEEDKYKDEPPDSEPIVIDLRNR